MTCSHRSVDAPAPPDALPRFHTMSLRPLPLLATAAVLIVQSSIGLAADGDLEPSSLSAIVVELSDILISSKSSKPRLEGYLIIWNGTGQSAIITDVRSQVFEEIKFVQTMKTGAETEAVMREKLSIPAHSELLMRPGGVYLSIDPGERMPRAGEQIDLEVFYADGASEVVVAQVRAERAEIEDHHHGMPLIEHM